MRRLVIFGTSELAQLACIYFEAEAGCEVAGFTVDRAYRTESLFMNRPLVPFDQVEEHFPPSEFGMFVSVGYAKLNAVRAAKCEESKDRGYRLESHISPRSAIWPDFEFGENCLVMEGVVVQPFVKIGNNVIIWCGSVISHHVEIGDNSFISAHAVISGRARIGRNCFIGVNATIRDKVNLADRTIVGSGALVLNDTEENCSYLGQASQKSGIPSHRLGALL